MKTIKLLAALLLLPSILLADDISVTVYNSNLGVISETRQLKFESQHRNTRTKLCIRPGQPRQDVPKVYR